MSEDSLEEKALELIKSRPNGVLQSDLWKDLDIDSRKCSRVIAKLEEDGKIKRTWETVKGTRTYRISYMPQKKEAPKKAVDFRMILVNGKIAPCIGCTYECEPDYCPDLGNWIELLSREPVQEEPKPREAPKVEEPEAPAEEEVAPIKPRKAAKAPAKAPEKAPVKVSEKVPEKVPIKAPVKVPVKVSEKVPAKAPAKAAVKAPEKPAKPRKAAKPAEEVKSKPAKEKKPAKEPAKKATISSKKAAKEAPVKAAPAKAASKKPASKKPAAKQPAKPVAKATAKPAAKPAAKATPKPAEKPTAKTSKMKSGKKK